MKMPPEFARYRVRAALGREPQDRLEAAVVLETWGVSTAHALDVAQPGSGPYDATPGRLPVQGGDDNSSRWQMVWLLLGVVAAVVWADEVLAALSLADARVAWRLALPVAFFVQWFARRRYLVGPGLARMRSDRSARWWVPVGSAVVAAALSASAVSASIAALVIVWTSMIVLVQRGWGGVYVALLAAQAASPLAVHPAFRTALAVQVAVHLLVTVAAVRSQGGAPSTPLRCRDAAVSGLLGGLWGLVLALLPLPDLQGQRVEAVGVALLPQLAGSAAWFTTLGRFWVLLRARTLSIVITSGPPRLSGVARRLLAGAATAYVVACVVADLLLVLAGHVRGGTWQPTPLTVAELAVAGLAGAALASLDTFGRTFLAIALAGGQAVVALVATALTTSHVQLDTTVQVGALSGCAVLGFAVLYHLFAEPERTYAQNF